MTAAGLATWVTFDEGSTQHALRTNTRTECGRRTQGHDVTPGPRNSLRRGCVLCTRRIDGYNAFGELVTAERDHARRAAVTLEREVAALRVEVNEITKGQPTP
jgi:hypothetical protein